MASQYFKNFPTITYNNNLVTNIIARAKIDSVVRDRALVFFPYTLIDGERPDTIAANYYEDPNFAWLIYYANEMIDPYFEWPLTQDELYEHIKIKYQSIAKAQDTIVFFRNNWSVDESIISIGAYQSLPGALKKYWQPIFDYRNAISSYQRAKNDTVIETNKVVEITHDGETIFTLNDIVKQGANASGIVKHISAGKVVVEKIQGEFTNTTITNYDESVSAEVTDTVTLNQAIPDNELIYWSGVSAYDYEEELNEQKKTIYILDRAYLDQIEMEMKSLLI